MALGTRVARPDHRRAYISRPMRLRPLLIAPLATAAVVASIAGCGGSSSTVATVTPNHVSEVKGCKAVAAASPKPATEGKPDPLVKKGQKATATVKTSCGSFDIALDTTSAPVTANAFANLAKDGVYDGTDFHRVVTDFVIQGGNQQLTGPDNASFTAVEAPPQDFVYKRGVVAMGKAQLDPIGASTGEFFVVTAPAQASLQPDYAVIGKISSGMATVNRIASLADPSLGKSGGEPVQPVLIDSVTIH
jgi:peptidyl-prolyl cis-trans isomerase B (cyclophilin B)